MYVGMNVYLMYFFCMYVRESKCLYALQNEMIFSIVLFIRIISFKLKIRLKEMKIVIAVYALCMVCISYVCVCVSVSVFIHFLNI